MKALLFHRSDCSTFGPRLGPYLDGELAEARQQSLKAHVGSCQSCSAELDRLQRLRNQIHRNLTASLSGKDAGRFWEHVERKIGEGKVPRWRMLDRVRELFWFYPKVSWASAAVLVTTVFLFAVDLLLRPAIPPPTPLGPTEPGPKTVVESVEGGPNNSVVLFSTPDQRLKIIWILERKRL